jgi:hypothetical protein
MIVDLNNTTEYDKQIIYLNSKNATFNTTGFFDFYINFEDPIKNISSVKIIDASIILSRTDRTDLDYNDIYYIELNDYHRISTYVKNKGSAFNYFDAIPFTYVDYLNASYSYCKFKIFYALTSSNWTDPTLYTLNPIEHNTKRFNIKIRDKNFAILNHEEGESFNMTICVYTIKKNIYG